MTGWQRLMAQPGWANSGDAKLGIRGAFPATWLILFVMISATIGAGRYSADAAIVRNH